MNLKEDVDVFLSKYSSFSYEDSRGEVAELTGTLSIIDQKEGFLWGRFAIVYKISTCSTKTSGIERLSYPSRIPEVYLLDHPEMRDIDRHIAENGYCCLTTAVESRLVLGKKYTLIDFTEKLVIPFFARQIKYEYTGIWPTGEYSHYNEGLYEYYQLRLGLNSKEKVVPALQVLGAKKKVGRNENCFCGSGVKYKKCCLQKVEMMQENVEREYFLRDLEEILEMEAI